MRCEASVISLTVFHILRFFTTISYLVDLMASNMEVMFAFLVIIGLLIEFAVSHIQAALLSF